MSEDRDRIDRLSGDTPPGPTEDTVAASRQPVDPADDATPIPVRVMRTGESDPRAAAEANLRRADADIRAGDEIVREYERKYYGDGETSTRRARAEELASEWVEYTRARWKPESRPVEGLSEDERLWAALAHASALLTVAVGIVTGGWATLLLIFAPLAIYFTYRDRSDFIAFHALQAFALQLVGIIGWTALLIVGVLVLVVAIVISAIASIVLVGIPFLLIFALLLVLFVPLSLLLPLGMVVFSILGAMHTYNGNDYRYPFISRWIDRQIDGGDVVSL